jgi:hypothetical protein
MNTIQMSGVGFWAACPPQPCSHVFHASQCPMRLDN